MRIRWLSVLVMVLLFGTACTRDANVAKRKYLESGNRYFAKGKYNEASIMYRSALKKDMRYGEAYYRLGLTHLRLNNPVAAERALRRAFGLPLSPRYKEDVTSKLSDIYLIAYLADPTRTKSYETAFLEFVNQLPKGSFDRLRLEGYKAWREKDLDTALADFKAASALKPLNPNLNLAYAEVLLGKKEFEAAEALAKNLIAKNKDYGPAYDLLYAYYLARGRPADAEQVRKQKSDNNPTVLSYRLQLASHYFQTNRPELAAGVINAVVADRKTFPKGRESAGDFYLSVRQFDKAIEYYKGGLGGTKEERLALQRKIADALIMQGKRDQALALLDNVILKENPKDSMGLALRATLWLEMGNRTQLQQAVSELETAVSKLPRNAVVRYNLGRAYWAKGETDLARAQFRAALDIQPDYLAPRLAITQIQLNRGEYVQALQSANETLNSSPGNQAARLFRSAALQGIGKVDDARRELLDLLQANPNLLEAKYRLGLLEITTKNYAAAEQVFRRCLDSSKKEMACTLGLAQVFTSQRQFDKAMQLLAAEQQKNPDRQELRLALANTCVLAQEYDRATELFKQAIAKEPESSDLHLRLAETYRRMGNIPGAIENFRRVKQLQPNNPDAAVWLALLLHQIGREADAKVEYERILRLQPDNPIALNNLAFVLAEQGGDLDVALTYAQRAKQKLPQSPEVADTLGWIYIKKNLVSDALSIYGDLVAKEPARATFRYHWAMALFQHGEKVRAKQELETALRNKPSADEAGKIKELLLKIG